MKIHPRWLEQEDYKLRHWRQELRTLAGLIEREYFKLARGISRRAADAWPPCHDDDDPITRQWAVTALGNDKFWITTETCVLISDDDRVYLSLGLPPTSKAECLPQLTTRRQLRDLLDALGWGMAESSISPQ